MDANDRSGGVAGAGFVPVRRDAPGPWRVEGAGTRIGAAPGGPARRVLYDASGAAIASEWAVTPNGLSGRTVTVSAPPFASASEDSRPGPTWVARSVGLTVSHLLIEGPGGALSLNRRDGGRGRDIIDVGERRFVARTKLVRGAVVVEIAGGSAESAGVDADLLAAAAFTCAHVDGPGRLMI